MNRALGYFAGLEPPAYSLWHDSHLPHEALTWDIRPETRVVTLDCTLAQILRLGTPSWADRTYCYRYWSVRTSKAVVSREDVRFPKGPSIACAALWLCWRLGARRVFFLGLDGYYWPDRYYAHLKRENRENPKRVGEVRQEADGRRWDNRAITWSRYLSEALQKVQAAGCWPGPWPASGVYNLSPQSLVTAFEKVPVEEALRETAGAQDE